MISKEIQIKWINRYPTPRMIQPKIFLGPSDDDDDESPPPGYNPNDPDGLVPPEHDGEGHDGSSVSTGRQGGQGSNN